jgi:hypothetical protein
MPQSARYCQFKNIKRIEDKMFTVTGKAIVVVKTTGKAGCFDGLFLPER